MPPFLFLALTLCLTFPSIARAAGELPPAVIFEQGTVAQVQQTIDQMGQLEAPYPDQGGATLLLLAAGSNPDAEVIRRLLVAGANIASTDANGQTALHRAAATNPKIEVIRLLLVAGANPMAVDKAGRTPLALAQQEGRSAEIVALLTDATERTAITPDDSQPIVVAPGSTGRRVEYLNPVTVVVETVWQPWGWGYPWGYWGSWGWGIGLGYWGAPYYRGPYYGPPRGPGYGPHRGPGGPHRGPGYGPHRGPPHGSSGGPPHGSDRGPAGPHRGPPSGPSRGAGR